MPPPNAAKPQTPAAPPAAAPQAAPAQPTAPAAGPAAAAPAPAPQTQPAAQPPAAPLFLTNASLLQAIDLLAKELHLNIILDPRVKGTVTINTYGEIRAGGPASAARNHPAHERLPDGAGRQHVPHRARGRSLRDCLCPLREANATKLPDDERLVLNLVFLQYVTSSEMAKILEPFNGEGAKMTPTIPRIF